jgi:crossover junction endodeoxyribonuclease RuvC
MRFVGIDPASKTGFVALDDRGLVVREKELTGIGDKDPKRMVTLIHEITAHLQPGDFICIEGFPFSTQKAMFAGGLHHGIRNELYKRKLPYYEVAPNAVKKYVGVTGWTGEKGSKKRLTGPQKKWAVMKAVFDDFGYEHRSDNVVDAYILARIAFELFGVQETGESRLSVNKAQVVDAILQAKTDMKRKA